MTPFLQVTQLEEGRHDKYHEEGGSTGIVFMWLELFSSVIILCGGKKEGQWVVGALVIPWVGPFSLSNNVVGF